MSQIRVIASDVVKKVLSMQECIEVNKRAFVSYHRGTANIPPRILIPVPSQQGMTLLKPGHIETQDDGASNSLGVKIVSVRPNNATLGLPTVPGVILMMDEVTGLPSALMDGTYLTALRTAAGSGVATRLLAKLDATNLVVFGAGMQAEAHIHAMVCVRPSISHVTIVNRTKANAESLSERLRAELQSVTFSACSSKDDADDSEREAIASALRGADIVCTTTNSSSPVFDGSLLPVGAHINAVGAYTPTMVEIDATTIQRSALVLDTPSALEAGDLDQPLKNGTISLESHVLASNLGQLVCAGPLGNDATAAGGADGGEIVEGDEAVVLAATQSWRAERGLELTLFKSVGTAVQDVATGHAVAERAHAMGLGSAVNL